MSFFIISSVHIIACRSEVLNPKGIRLFYYRYGARGTIQERKQRKGMAQYTVSCRFATFAPVCIYLGVEGIATFLASPQI